MKKKRPASEQAYVSAALADVVRALKEGDVYYDFGKFLIKESGGNLSSTQINDRLRHVLDGTQGPSAFVAIALLRFGDHLKKTRQRQRRTK